MTKPSPGIPQPGTTAGNPRKGPPGLLLPRIAARRTGEDEAMLPAYEHYAGSGKGRYPVLATFDAAKRAWTEETTAICVGRHMVGNATRLYTPAALCGEPAEHRIVGIDLCAHHFYALRHWRLVDAEADTLRREASVIRDAARELRAAKLDHARAVAENEAAWEEAKAEYSIVYYVRRVSDGNIKIGYSAKFRTRFSALQHEHGRLQILLLRGGARHQERHEHEKFKDYRVGRSEWFFPARPLLEFIHQTRKKGLHESMQPREVLPLTELRSLVRAAPMRKNLRWEDGVLQWPPDEAAA